MTATTAYRPRRYELPVFVLLAFAISWAMHIPLAIATLRSGDPAAQAGSILNFLAPWGPAVAAIIVTAIVMGARGPHRLLRQLKVWRVGLHWYLIAVLLPAAMWLIARAVDAVLGRTYSARFVARRPELRSACARTAHKRLHLHVGLELLDLHANRLADDHWY